MMLNQFNDVREGLLEVVRGALMETCLLMLSLECFDRLCKVAKVSKMDLLRYLRSDTGWLKQPTSAAHTDVKLLDRGR